MGFDPLYFMDKMKSYEIRTILESRQYRFRDEWDRFRTTSYIIAQANSTEKISPEDIISFPWDKKTIVETSEDDLERLRKKAQERINQYNTGG